MAAIFFDFQSDRFLAFTDLVPSFGHLSCLRLVLEKHVLFLMHAHVLPKCATAGMFKVNCILSMKSKYKKFDACSFLKACDIKLSTGRVIRRRSDDQGEFSQNSCLKKGCRPRSKCQSSVLFIENTITDF